MEPHKQLTKPEEEELHRKREELSTLEAELVEREFALTSLRSELVAFERLYLKAVGRRYAELDEIEAKIAEHLARLHPNKETQHAASEARDRASASRSVTEKASDGVEYTPKSSTLKTLYRAVAKRIHPDLATDSMDRARRQRLMADANRAYEEGDEARLREILDEYDASPESVEGEGTAADWVRVIRKIAQVKKRLSQIDQEVQTLKKSELFELKARVDQAKDAGHDLLDEMAEDVDAQIALSRKRLNQLSSEHADA